MMTTESFLTYYPESVQMVTGGHYEVTMVTRGYYEVTT